MAYLFAPFQHPIVPGPSQDTLTVMPAPQPLQMLENTPYQHPRRAVMKPGEEEHWTFSVRGTPGASLGQAYAETLHDLDGPDDALFPGGFLKVTFLMQFPGYQAFRRCKNVQRVKRGVAQPTRRLRVVECVAEAMALFLKQAVEVRPSDGAVLFGAGGIELSDLYLLELHRYGRTLIPILGFTPRAVLPEPSSAMFNGDRVLPFSWEGY